MPIDPVPYVLTITVLTGDPEGIRIIEKDDWKGRAILFRRDDLDRLNLNSKVTRDLQKGGVYVLLGTNPEDEDELRGYVGKSGEVLRRLTEHNVSGEKEFWIDTVVFVSTDESGLDATALEFLEAKLIEGGRQASRVRFDQKRQEIRELEIATNIKVNNFLASIFEVLSILGQNPFLLPEGDGGALSITDHRRQKDETVYFLRDESIVAEASMKLRPRNRCLVLKGSGMSKSARETLQPGRLNLRNLLIDNGVVSDQGNHFVFDYDHEFRSTSGAASILLGKSVGGPDTWKDSKGMTLNDHRQTLHAQPTALS